MEKVKKFYDATNDSMFKAIFTKPKNKDLLENLIGEALKTKVEVISILPPETPKENINIHTYCGYLFFNSRKKGRNAEGRA